MSAQTVSTGAVVIRSIQKVSLSRQDVACHLQVEDGAWITVIDDWQSIKGDRRGSSLSGRGASTDWFNIRLIDAQRSFWRQPVWQMDASSGRRTLEHDRRNHDRRIWFKILADSNTSNNKRDTNDNIGDCTVMNVRQIGCPWEQHQVSRDPGAHLGRTRWGEVNKKGRW